MANKFNLNSAQIRKDLAYFGEFGVRGVGYYVEDLRQHLMKILGMTERRRLAIVGMGNLGTALANYQGFNQNNFEVVAIFDDDPEKIGKRIRAGLEIQDPRHIGEIIKRELIEIIIIAVPAIAAEKVLERAMEAGIRAVLNFAPVNLNPRPGVKVKNDDLTISLESLSYFLANPSDEAVNVHYREFLRQDNTSSNGTGG